MNGLPIPSNDPEKNLNLEIFSTDIVEYISIDKVYGEVYMAILLEETLTLYQRTTKERGFKN
jgi:hypothetical protein